MPQLQKELYEFADFRLDVSERLLRRDGKRIPLTDKAFDTLCVLVRHAGELVTKDELMSEVWSDAIVEENNLDQKISMLRQALGERAKGKGKFIETVRGRGYRFLPEVRLVQVESNCADPVFLTKQSRVGADFQTAPSHYETQRSDNVLTVAEWKREEAENRVEKGVDKETDEKRGDTEIRQEREIKFFSAVKHNKTLTLIVLASFAVVVIAGVMWSRRSNGPQSTDAALPINSIAVLPFENVAQDVNAEYLSDGITESLINDLSQLQNLKVMSHSAVFRYKGKEQDANKVGGELNVQAVLTGSVKQIGDQIVIAVRLDDTRNNQHIWGEQYIRKFTDILNVQNEIARAVSTSLRLKLTGADEQRFAKRYTDNAEAYQLYLKGNYEWNKHTQENVQKAIEYFNQSLEKDPSYALAYFGLSSSYGLLGNIYLPPNENFPKARAYAAKGLAIDDSLAKAHTAMGAVRLFYDWDWAETEREFKHAQILDPRDGDAHQLFAEYLNAMGRFDEAQSEAKQAQHLDPLSAMFSTEVGFTFYYARQYDEAIAEFQKTLDLEPRYVDAYQYLGTSYEQKKMYKQAIETFQKGMSQSERLPQLIASLGHAYALAGERDNANKALAELREMSKQHYVSPYWTAVIYASLGDKEQTFTWLEKAYQDRASLLIWLKVEPQFDSLHDDPRFKDLLRRIGLQP
jgi:TolB-like protein/DNA-binding winged helix-turn-helix (wHTH) protein/Flp pilus assembly protein TadD